MLLVSDSGVVVRLSSDEALVLFEWLEGIGGRDDVYSDQAEQRAVWDLAASLEPQVSALFSANYSQAVELARSRVRDQIG
jgi:hypothetical protein